MARRSVWLFGRAGDSERDNAGEREDADTGAES